MNSRTGIHRDTALKVASNFAMVKEVPTSSLREAYIAAGVHPTRVVDYHTAVVSHATEKAIGVDVGAKPSIGAFSSPVIRKLQ